MNFLMSAFFVPSPPQGGEGNEDLAAAQLGRSRSG